MLLVRSFYIVSVAIAVATAYQLQVNGVLSKFETFEDDKGAYRGSKIESTTEAKADGAVSMA